MAVMPMALGALVFIPMVIEAVVSVRHEAVLRKMGAVEPADDVYRAMQFAYPAAFVAFLVEASLRGAPADGIAAVGLLVFLAAKTLKYWAILTLGVRWTFRVLVPPGSDRIVGGPYQYVRHPNYVAVLGELAGAALMAHALVSGPLATMGFMALIWRRIVVEERALGPTTR